MTNVNNFDCFIKYIIDVYRQYTVLRVSVWLIILYKILLNGPVAQLVRAPPCHGGGHGFESRLGRSHLQDVTNEYGVLAQLGEHLPYKQRVIGSSPIGPIICRCGSIGRAADL